MILEKFFTNEYDNELLFINEDVTFGEFKDYVYGQTKVLEQSSATTVVLLCEKYFDFAVNFFAAIFAKKKIILVTDKNRLSLLQDEYVLPELPEKCKWKNFACDINAQDVMVNLFTSGSTGTPKLMGKTLYNLEQEARTTIDEFNFPKNSLICSTTLSSHSYGIAFNFILPFYAGFKIAQTKIDFPEQFPNNGNYVLISTPSFVEKLVKYDYEFQNPPEVIFLAGAKLEDKVFNYLSKFSNVIDIYGSTETGNIAYKQGGSVFTVLKNVEISTDDENKIIVKSDFFPEREIVLNDIIKMLESRKFQLKKRTDRIVKIQEKRISLNEIENLLKNFPNVDDVCCFQDGDRISCAIVTKKYDLNSVELKKYLANYIEILPKKWRFLDEIPHNATGKIDYEKLKRFFNLNLSLPFVIERKVENGSCQIKMIFKKSSNFFNGHFDVKPIVPGVVQLFYAKFFAEDVFGVKMSDCNLKKVKFSNIINPDEVFTLKLFNKENSVEMTYMSDDKVFSSGIFLK